ncbi:MAG: hypothetical protein IVW57_15500 [Ktedonobacterales bacterium]|nr:hypothetical protein [Ktedonobacterales bacterium]
MPITNSSHAWVSRGALLSVLLTALLGVVLTACGGTSTPTVTITAKEYTFTMPDTLPAGQVDITLVNRGKEPHQANIARLNNGVTEQKFQTTLKNGPAAVLGLVTLVGGPNTVDPGKSQEVVLNLAQGQYVTLCFLTSSNGKTHVEQGMIKFSKVNGPPSSNQPDAPKSTGDVTLKDFTIAVPSNLKAGAVTWKVTNKGPQSHEMTLLKLASGKSLNDVMAFLNQSSGQPPFADAGGIGALAPNTSAWVKLTLEKGNYVALCFVPDSRSGKPHFAEGMVTQFSIK